MNILHPMNRYFSWPSCPRWRASDRCRLYAQAAADSGMFVIRHAGDTVATESFTRTPDHDQRHACHPKRRRDVATLLPPSWPPTERCPMIEVTVRQDADSGRVKGEVVSRARVIFKEDSAAVDEANGAGLKTLRLRHPPRGDTLSQSLVRPAGAGASSGTGAERRVGGAALQSGRGTDGEREGGRASGPIRSAWPSARSSITSGWIRRAGCSAPGFQRRTWWWIGSAAVSRRRLFPSTPPCGCRAMWSGPR